MGTILLIVTSWIFIGSSTLGQEEILDTKEGLHANLDSKEVHQDKSEM